MPSVPDFGPEKWIQTNMMQKLGAERAAHTVFVTLREGEDSVNQGEVRRPFLVSVSVCAGLR